MLIPPFLYTVKLTDLSAVTVSLRWNTPLRSTAAVCAAASSQYRIAAFPDHGVCAWLLAQHVLQKVPVGCGIQPFLFTMVISSLPAQHLFARSAMSIDHVSPILFDNKPISSWSGGVRCAGDLALQLDAGPPCTTPELPSLLTSGSNKPPFWPFLSGTLPT